MSEEVRVLKEIVDNNDLDNYAIDDDECYLNAYARKCLKKVLDQLQQKENIIKEAIEYINKTQMGEGYKKMLLEILDKENKK